jgi:ferrous iron transport protein B
VFAIPAGMVIWLVGNVTIGGETIANIFINWVDPFAFILGLNGVIILAYIIAIPANEIVIPTVLMLTVMSLGLTGVGSGSGVMFETDTAFATKDILIAGGWTLLTGINLMLFSLLHNPCSTTIYTIYKETKSVKWTLVSTFLPIALGLIVTFFVTQIWRLFSNS